METEPLFQAGAMAEGVGGEAAPLLRPPPGPPLPPSSPGKAEQSGDHNLGLSLDGNTSCWGSLGDSSVHDSISSSVHGANNIP